MENKCITCDCVLEATADESWYKQCFSRLVLCQPAP